MITEESLFHLEALELDFLVKKIPSGKTSYGMIILSFPLSIWTVSKLFSKMNSPAGTRTNQRYQAWTNIHYLKIIVLLSKVINA